MERTFRGAREQHALLCAAAAAHGHPLAQNVSAAAHAAERTRSVCDNAREEVRERTFGPLRCTRSRSAQSPLSPHQCIGLQCRRAARPGCVYQMCARTASGCGGKVERASERSVGCENSERGELDRERACARGERESERERERESSMCLCVCAAHPHLPRLEIGLGSGAAHRLGTSRGSRRDVEGLVDGLADALIAVPVLRRGGGDEEEKGEEASSRVRTNVRYAGHPCRVGI